MLTNITLNISLKILGVLIILLINKNNAENLTLKFDIIKSLNNEKTNELNKILIDINSNNLFDSKNYINVTEKIAFILLPKPINSLLSMSSSIILKYYNTNNKKTSNNTTNIDSRKNLNTNNYEKSIIKIGNETSCYLENLTNKITNEIDKLMNHNKTSTMNIDNETKNQNTKLKILYEMKKTIIYFNNFYDDNINCLLTNECVSYEREKLFDILINRSSKFRISLLTFVTQYIDASQNEEHGFFYYVLHEFQKRAKERRDCNIEVEQSEIYRLYISLILTLEKCYSLTIAAYMIRYRENISNQTISMGYFSSAIKSFKKLNEDTIFITKNAENIMKQLSTEMRRCDPHKHIKGVTYDRFVHVYGTYTGFTWNRFYNDQHHNYTYVDRSRNPSASNYSDGIYGSTNQGWIRLGNNCSNDNNIAEIRHYYNKNHTDRLYHHFEITYKNNTRETFGKLNSKNNQNFVMKYFPNRLKFGNNFCGRYCRSPVKTCSIEDFNKTIRHISLMSVDATPNFVVTGIRWRIKKKILYFEIQEGKYFNDDIVNSTIHWKKTPTHEIENKTIAIGDNFAKGFILDNIFLPSGYYLTGIQFVQNNIDDKNDNLVKIKIKGNRNIDKNINDTVYRTMNSISKNSLQLQMDEPDASEFSLNNMILSKPGDYVYFKSSDMKKDAGQSSVPYLDIQSIETTPARPLSGIGSYYKGTNGFGGFVALRAFVCNMTNLVNPMNIEIYTTIIENVIEKLQDEK